MPDNTWVDLLRALLRILWRAWLVGGIAALLAGCGFAAYQSIWLLRSAPANGLVIQLSPIKNQDESDTSYAPRFTFRDDLGHDHTVTSRVQSNPPEFRVGEQVRVRYIRSDPSSAKIVGFWQLWLVPFVCTILGVFFSVAGYLLLRLERRFR